MPGGGRKILPTVQCQYAGARIDSFPVRFYFTAARSISRCPRESFYHVACAVAGAKNAEQAQRDVWSSFTGFRNGRFVTNARGQRLGFWRDQKPGSEQTKFIDRTAQDLVTLTDSSCRAWAELFREALAMHGIAATVRAVRPKLSLVHPRLGLPTFTVPDGRGGSTVTRTVGILVKPFKWTPQNQLTPSPFSPQQAMVHAGGFRWKLNNPIDAGTATWPQTDAEDLLRPSHTLPQDAGQTRGIFGNHAVVLVKNANGETWYDPSFGFGPHSSLKNYEDELLGRGEENHGGLFAIVGWKREEKTNPATGTAEIESSATACCYRRAPTPCGNGSAGNGLRPGLTKSLRFPASTPSEAPHEHAGLFYAPRAAYSPFVMTIKVNNGEDREVPDQTTLRGPSSRSST